MLHNFFFFTVPPTKAACAFLRGSLFFYNMQVSFPLPGISHCYSTASARSKSSHCLPPPSALSTTLAPGVMCATLMMAPCCSPPPQQFSLSPLLFLFSPCLFPLSFFFSFFPSYYLRLALLLVTIKCGFMRWGAYCRKIRDVCTLIRNCVFVTSVSGAKDGSTKRLDSDAFAFLVQTTCQPCFLARWP